MSHIISNSEYFDAINIINMYKSQQKEYNEFNKTLINFSKLNNYTFEIFRHPLRGRIVEFKLKNELIGKIHWFETENYLVNNKSFRNLNDSLKYLNENMKK
jgi:hypothetical protein